MGTKIAKILEKLTGNPAFFKVKLFEMDLSSLSNNFMRMEEFFRDCLNLLNEVSILSVLHKVARLASTTCNATYCIAGTVTDEDQFDTMALYGFTQVEQEILYAPELPGKYRINNIRGSSPANLTGNMLNSEEFQIFPDNKPVVSNLLFIPISYNRKKLGSIILVNRIGGSCFDTFDEKLVTFIADYAAMSINNSTVYSMIAEHERELARRNEDLALLNEVARISISGHDEQEKIVEESMLQVMGYLDIELGEFFIRDDEDPSEYKLIFKRGHSFTTSLFGFSSVNLGKGIVGKVALTRRNYVLNENEVNIINQKGALAVDLNHIVVMPLVTSDGVVGVACYGTKTVDETEKLNLLFLSSINSWIATLIQDYRLTRESKRVAILEERQRIGMDLHDGVIQSIYGVGLTLEHARLLTKTDPEESGLRIQESIKALNGTIQDIRSYIMNLKPARLTNENLVQSLRRLTNDFASNTLVVTTFESNIENINGLSPKMVNTFYLICNEALANVTKHARATEVAVSFKEKEHGYVLVISDDGVGFNPVRDRRSSSHGINNIFARAKGLRGNFDIQSAVGKGTTLTVFLPKNPSEQHEQTEK